MGYTSNGIYQINLPSGSFQCYCEMGLNGGGYTFIPTNVIPKLLSEDITYLLNGKKKADDVIMSLSKHDGSQP